MRLLGHGRVTRAEGGYEESELGDVGGGFKEVLIESLGGGDDGVGGDSDGDDGVCRPSKRTTVISWEAEAQIREDGQTQSTI